MDNTSESAVTSEAGFQIGGGLYLNKEISLDLTFRQINFHAKAKQKQTSAVYDFQKTKMEGLQVGLRYYFN